MQVAEGVFVVSGAASGLGAQTARAIVGAGGRVVLADSNAAGGQEMAAELGDRSRFCETDVTDAASAARCISGPIATFGTINGLVNCAGVATAGQIIGKQGPHDLDVFLRAVSVNLVGTFNMLRLAAAAMAQSAPTSTGERGVIVNTASIAAYDGMIGQAAYAASKAGVAGMTLPIARELAAHSIRVVSIAPGIFETNMLQGISAGVRDGLYESVPFPKRAGDPPEFARLVLHVIENTYLNGAVLRLDGALRMGSS